MRRIRKPRTLLAGPLQNAREHTAARCFNRGHAKAGPDRTGSGGALARSQVIDRNPRACLSSRRSWGSRGLHCPVTTASYRPGGLLWRVRRLLARGGSGHDSRSFLIWPGPPLPDVRPRAVVPFDESPGKGEFTARKESGGSPARGAGAEDRHARTACSTMRMNDRSPHELQEDRFPPLWERFEQEYGEAYVRLASHLRETYPDITRKGRRTGRALRNICFFVWFYTRTGDTELIPTMLNASVLLSAQDDFYDNPRIPSVQKEAFCSAINHSIKTCTFHSATDRSRQVRELTSLWSVVARPIQRASPPVHLYWNEKACQLNEAMTAENRAIRRADISFDEYMETAVHSIGMIFVWSTYLVHKNVPISTIRDMHAVLLLGAKIARLSNDIASYRQGKNNRNAVILLGGGGSAERRIIQLMARESRMFQKYLEALRVAPAVKRVLLRSTEFLKVFYQRSDFDKRALW